MPEREKSYNYSESEWKLKVKVALLEQTIIENKETVETL